MKKPAPKTKLQLALVMVMPVEFTSPGRRPCTLATRFCTSTAAMSRLYPVWKVMVIELVPLLVLEELM